MPHHDLEMAWGSSDEWIAAMADGVPYSGSVMDTDSKYQLHPSKLASAFAAYVGTSTKRNRLGAAIVKLVTENLENAHESLQQIRGYTGLFQQTSLMFKGATTSDALAVRFAELMKPADVTQMVWKAAVTTQYYYGVCVGCARINQAFLTTPAHGLSKPRFYLRDEELSPDCDISWRALACYCENCKVKCVGCKSTGISVGMMSADLRTFATEGLCEKCLAGRLGSVLPPTIDRKLAKRLCRSKYILID